ncbi:hypothetical protein GCM10011512_29870 [Tersicoccus solisilvae]|uniref:DUF4192 domain-containing protein n=1 Tax=Tersicoccus solisilvae TaxID=1882339 RepID=A0ABQ1PPS2_9MICC|nr:DUF4192 family protein [Tersicoccus solisilvae]GGD01010.1 hypothetical protein GCM10011512_29870 [Tersicoccus solisilvae]
MTRSPAAAIRSAEDLLAYIPFGLGHWPRESLVVLADAGGQAGGLLRLDLPARCTASTGGQLGRYVQSVLAPGAPSGVFVVVYTSARPRTGSGLPVLVHRLVRTLERQGVGVRDCLYVGDEGWGHVDAARPDAPWGRRRPLDDIAASVLNAELVFAGRAWGPEPTPVVLPAPSGPDAEAIRSRTAAHAVRAHPDPPDPAWARTVVAAWEDTLVVAGRQPDGRGLRVPVPLDPDAAGLLLAGLRSRTLRDLLLFQSAVGPSPVISDLLLDTGLREAKLREAVRTEVRGRDAGPRDPAPPGAADGDPAGHRTPAERCRQAPVDRDAFLRAGGVPLLASVITGSVALVPDWARLDAAYRTLEALAPHADGQVRCATLTLLGWIEFARGRGSRAHHLLDAALREDSGYELARLFDRFLDLGQVHEWARHPSTAWHGGHPDAA